LKDIFIESCFIESFFTLLKDWLLKVILLKVKSLLKVESHYLKTMTRGIYIL
jgi:hypothetical protein